MIRSGLIDIHAEPELLGNSGPMERWDGKLGPGNLNAWHCMERAIALSHEHGMGCVALANTNHWMRGGSYGWQAADAGVIGICWTNTLPNLPPWGASDPRVGNNPLVIAVPRPDGHVVLDMAMSQFSYGALASYRMRGELLPVDGGFDAEGKLTRDPGSDRSIKSSFAHRLLEGFRPGLDAGPAGGDVVGRERPLTRSPRSRAGNHGYRRSSSHSIPSVLGSKSQGNTTAAMVADQVIEYFQLPPNSTGERVRYPGYRVLHTRKENLANGIPVEPSIWQQLHSL